MKPRKSDYERLKEVWYKKLKDEGFEDLEHSDGSLNNATPSSIRANNEHTRLKAETTRDYYCMAYYFLNEYEFDTEVDKIMWEYHTNGIPCRQIAKLLNEAKVTKTSRDIVWRKLKKLEAIMKNLYLSV